MSSFDERQKGEEAKFAHDASLRFRAEARRNKHLAHWACAELGIEDDDGIANYLAEVIAIDMAKAGHADVVDKLRGDFEEKGVDIGTHAIEAKVAEFDMRARQEILSEG